MGKVEIIKLDHHGRGLGKINEKVIFIYQKSNVGGANR